MVGQALTPASYYTAADIERLRSLFKSVQPYGADLETVYYSILGFSLLDDSIPVVKVSLATVHDMCCPLDTGYLR